MSPSANVRDGNELELRCVNCGWAMRRLFMQYSPGNIRLMKCESCKSIADPHIECEFMIVLINLILHKTEAYRHLLYNMLNQGPIDFKVTMEVLFGNFMFIYVLFIGTRFLLNSSLDITRCRHILLGIIISSYFKLFLIAMLVWEFPPSVILIVDVFVLSSNAVALRVLTQSRASGCIGVCFTAHAAKFFANQLLLPLLFGAIEDLWS